MDLSNINGLLSVDMLYPIFRLLPARDLRAVVLVCTQWMAEEEAPWPGTRLQA